MKSIVFIAPPAAGKGTQSKLISKKFGIPHISTGDLLRDTNNTEINKLLKKGHLVDDKLIIPLLEERLKNKDCDNGYILDGFPRNLTQAYSYEKLLDKLGKREGIVIILELEKEISQKRIIGRLVCHECGAIYNELFEEDKPKIKGICNFCKSTLTKREDDNLETFENRYNIYEKETGSLINYYKDKGIAYLVDSGIGEDYTFNEINKIIGGVV